MISCRLALCAEGVTQDTDTNSVSVFSILEEMVPSSYPFTLPKLTCLFLMAFEGKEGTTIPASLNVTHGENELFKRNIDIDFRKKRNVRLVFHLHGIPIEEPGKVRVAILHERKEVGGWTFVFKNPPPPEESKPEEV